MRIHVGPIFARGRYIRPSILFLSKVRHDVNMIPKWE